MYKRTAVYRMDYRVSERWKRSVIGFVETTIETDIAYKWYMKSQLARIGFREGQFKVEAVHVRNDIIVIHVRNLTLSDVVYLPKDLSARLVRRVDSQINALLNAPDEGSTGIAMQDGEDTH